MTWMYKSFTYKPKPRAFATTDNLLRNDPKLEKILNHYGELGWDYLEAISLNTGLFTRNAYLILLRGKKGSAFNTAEEKVLKGASTQVK